MDMNNTGRSLVSIIRGNNKNESSSSTALTTSIIVEGCESTYQDYLTVSCEEIKNRVLINSSTIKQRQGPRGGVSKPFPVILYKMLENVEKDGLDDIISWQPHGRSFRIHNPKVFINDIMPKFFKQTKLTSFRRQLNLYDFHNITCGPDHKCHYHPLFLRGRPDLCYIMIRTRVKGGSSSNNEDLLPPPNIYHCPSIIKSIIKVSSFYDLPPCPSCADTGNVIIQENNPNTAAFCLISDDDSMNSEQIMSNNNNKCQNNNADCHNQKYTSSNLKKRSSPDGDDNTKDDVSSEMDNSNNGTFDKDNVVETTSSIPSSVVDAVAPLSSQLDNPFTSNTNYYYPIKKKRSCILGPITKPKALGRPPTLPSVTNTKKFQEGLQGTTILIPSLQQQSCYYNEYRSTNNNYGGNSSNNNNDEDLLIFQGLPHQFMDREIQFDFDESLVID